MGQGVLRCPRASTITSQPTASSIQVNEVSLPQSAFPALEDATLFPLSLLASERAGTPSQGSIGWHYLKAATSSHQPP